MFVCIILQIFWMELELVPEEQWIFFFKNIALNFEAIQQSPSVLLKLNFFPILEHCKFM